MIKAVIFDMDGVIADSLVTLISADRKILSLYGITLTHDEILSEFNGVTDPEMYDTLSKRYHIPLDHQKIAQEKFQIFKELAKEGLVAIPGVIDLIERLSKKFPLGLGSSSPKEIIDFILTTLHVKEKFQAITSPDEVTYGKPDPEMYLLTAKKLHISPKDCVVIEDAPKGITAAKAAGMKCLAITTTHPKEQLQAADNIIDSFKNLSIEDIQHI